MDFGDVFMKANLSRKTVLLFVIPLLLSLAFLPAVCRAAPPAEALPEPTDFLTVRPDTLTTSLRTIFQLNSSFSITVYKADGSVRSSGLLETGDRAVIRGADGMTSCVLITVGQPSPSSGVSSGSSAPPASSSPPSSASSSPASGTSPSADSKEAVFDKPVDAASAAGLFADCAARATVFAPDGSERKSGPVCTDDRIVLQDKSGAVLRMLPVTVLGDLTRCGKPTEDGCSLLYEYLTGNASLPDDLSAAADINRDGRIDTADLLKMKLTLLENPPSSGG